MNLTCVRCAGQYPRDPDRKMQAMLCPPCQADRDQEIRTELAIATVEGERRTRYRDWQRKLWEAHRNGRHKVLRKAGCSACDIQYSEKMQPQPDTDDSIPRALR